MKKSNPFFFADFETTTAKQSTTSTSVWIWGIKGTLPSDKMSWDIDMESFFKYLKKNNMQEIFFHNLNFDGDFIFKYMLKNYKSVFVKHVMGEYSKLEENEWSWICDDTGNIYSLEFNYQGHIMSFYDSWKVLMASVEDLGKNLKMEKMELDYDFFKNYSSKSEVPENAIEYLERDIDIVIDSFKKVSEIYEIKLTRASTAYKSFMEHYGEMQFAKDFGGMVKNHYSKKTKWKNLLNWYDWELGHSTYQGGYVNWNKEIEGKLIENIKGVCIDVNSLYPSCMMNYPSPYGKLLYNPPLQGTYETVVTVLIESAVKKNPKAPNLIKDRSKSLHTLEEKYTSHLEYEIRSFWIDEFNFICDHYDVKFTILSKRYLKTKFIFKDWLETLNHWKTNAKDQTEADFHKGIFNSLYGKLCQHWDVRERVIIKDEDHFWKARARYGEHGEYTYDIISGGKPNKDTRFKHIFAGSYITHKARMVLWNCIFNNLDLWIYSDTDSGYFLGMPSGIEIHESKFGAWKAEYKFDKIKVIRAKCYMFHAYEEYSKKEKKFIPCDKTIKKVAGLGKGGKKLITFENFKRGLEIPNGKLASKSVDGGKLLIPISYKIGEI